MRLLIIFLLILIGLGSAGLFFAEPLMVRTLQHQLKLNEIDLTTFDIHTLEPTRVELNEIALRGAGFRVSVQGIQVEPLPNTDVTLTIDQVSVAIVEQDGVEPGANIAELLELLDSTVASLPESGSIGALQYCQPELCLQAKISWQRRLGSFRADINLVEHGAHLVVTHQDDWQLRAYADGDFGRLLGEFELRQDGDLLFLRNQVRVQPSAQLLQDTGLTSYSEVLIQPILIEGESRMPIKAKPEELISELISAQTIEFNALLDAEVADLALKLEGSHKYSAAYSDQDLQISLLQLPQVRLAQNQPLPISGILGLTGQASCALSLSLGGLECGLEALDLSFESTSEMGSLAGDINLTNLEFGLTFGEVFGNGTGTIAVFDLEQGVEVINSTLQFALAEDVVTLSSENGQLLASPLLFDIRHELDEGTGEGSVDWRSDNGVTVVLDFALENQQLAAYGELAEGVSAGHHLSSRLSWQSDTELLLTHNTELSVTGLTVDYDGYELNDGRLNASLAGWPELRADLSFTAASIDVGLPLTDFKSELTIFSDLDSLETQVSAEKLSVKVLGGSINSRLLQFQYPTLDGAAVLTIEGLQVKELLALQPQNIEGSGLISGSVPVQIRNGSLSIEQSEIAAVAPGGYIRFTAEESVRVLADTNASMAVVLDAMEDFHYHTLSAIVDYGEDGQMYAQTSVKGANPNYQGGREVHLNLNLEENILVLLQSLRLGEDLAEKISEKTTTR